MSTAWHESQRNLADLAHYMVHIMGSTASEVGYAIEKPWKHEDVWRECQALLPLECEADPNA